MVHPSKHTSAWVVVAGLTLANPTTLLAASNSSTETLSSSSTSPGTPSAEHSAVLPSVTVTEHYATMDEAPEAAPGGQVAKGARLGILGNVSVMETPFSVTSYTAQTIANEQARSVADLMAADSSVRMASSRSNINEDLTIRGFPVASSDFALNGMFGLLPHWRVPLEAAERVEIIKGPSAALYGMSPAGSVGGVVNLVPKRATAQPITRLELGVASDSVVTGHADIGRRFGEDGAFGVRLNLMHRNGDTAIRQQSTRESVAALALDFRHARLRSSLDLLYSEERIDNVVRQFTLAPSLTTMPRAPSGKLPYPGLGWTDGDNRSFLWKGEYDLTDTLTAYAGFGKHTLSWTAFAANPHIMNAAGDYAFFGGLQSMAMDSRTFEAGLRGSLETGDVSHQLALGFTQLKQDAKLGFLTTFPPGMSNLYAGNLFPTPNTAGLKNPLLPFNESRLSSVALADTMGMLDGRFQVTLGLRRQSVEGQSYNFMNGAPSGPRYDKQATTPFAGVVFKLRPELSLYASYVEGLSKGDTAPVSAALTNPGEVLAPFRSQQKEVGVKWQRDGLLATLSLFDLLRPSSGVSGTTFGEFGEQRNRGIETSFAGEAARGIRLLGGVTYTSAKMTKAVSPELRGKQAMGVARWQLNLGSEWDVPMLPGLTLSGRLIHTDKMAVTPTNSLYIPSWQRVDAGVRYAAQWGARQVTLRLNVENAFDKKYWGTATAGYLFVGSPRTYTVSMGVDL